MARRTDDASSAARNVVSSVPLKAVAESVDRLFHATVLNRPRVRSAEDLGPRERIGALRELVTGLEDRFADTNPFPAPPTADPETRAVRRDALCEVIDMRFESSHQLALDEVRERWSRHPSNAQVPVRWFRGGENRPAILLLHGYLGGPFAFEERVWPIRWLLRKGMDALLFTLPFHGGRADRRGAPPFPAADPRFTIEGFRQAIDDIGALTKYLRARGAPAVGIMGMSLGGYTSALAATAVPLDFAIPFIPLASIADFAREGGRLIGTASQRHEQHELLERTYSFVSPLHREPIVPPEGRLIVAGGRDRITPVRHAERIAARFDAPLVVFSGGHLFQVGRSKGFRAVGRMLGDLGLLSPKDAS